MAMSVMCDSENGRWHTGPSSLTQQFLIAHEWRPDIAKAISATVMASSCSCSTETRCRRIQRHGGPVARQPITEYLELCRDHEK